MVKANTDFMHNRNLESIERPLGGVRFLMKKYLSIYHLAAIAVVVMISDHIAWRIMDFFTLQAQVVHFLGSLLMPIACFVVVEAFKREQSGFNCLLHMIGFWIFSIYPYNMFMGTAVRYRQNLLYNMVLVLFTLYIIRSVEKNEMNKITTCLLFGILLFLSFVSCENAIISILLAIIYYKKDITKETDLRNIRRLILYQMGAVFVGFLISAGKNVLHHNIWYQDVFMFGCMLAIPIILFYKGDGPERKRFGRVFYYIYPLQFIILGSVLNVAGYSYYKFYLNLNVITVLVIIGYGHLALKAKPSKAQLSNLTMIIFGLFYLVGLHIQLTTKDVRVVNLAVKIEYMGMVGALVSFIKFLSELL